MTARRVFLAAGVLLSVLWVVCWNLAVDRNSHVAVYQWAVGNGLAALAGAAYGAAALARSRPTL